MKTRGPSGLCTTTASTLPPWIASMVSSASLDEAVLGLRSAGRLRTELPLLLRRLDIEPDQHLLGIRQVADDPLQWLGKVSDQGRDRDNLVPLRQRGIFHQVNHLDLVAAREMLLAELREVGDRGHRLGSLARHIEPEVVAVLFSHVRSTIR